MDGNGAMDDRNNTWIGWILFAGIVALGFTSLSGQLFRSENPEKMGFAVEGAAAAGGAAAAPIPIGTMMASADPSAGEQVFKKCMACHTVTQGGANGIGPNLYAVLGEGIAQGRGGFAFSDALKSVGGNWGFENLNAWLISPRAFAPGTKMSFAGLSDPKDRANVIAYLNAQGSNLPLPPAPAAADVAAAAAAAPAAAEGGAAGAATAAAPATPAAAPAK